MERESESSALPQPRSSTNCKSWDLRGGTAHPTKHLVMDPFLPGEGREAAKPFSQPKQGKALFCPGAVGRVQGTGPCSLPLCLHQTTFVAATWRAGTRGGGQDRSESQGRCGGVWGPPGWPGHKALQPVWEQDKGKYCYRGGSWVFESQSQSVRCEGLMVPPLLGTVPKRQNLCSGSLSNLDSLAAGFLSLGWVPHLSQVGYLWLDLTFYKTALKSLDWDVHLSRNGDLKQSGGEGALFFFAWKSYGAGIP